MGILDKLFGKTKSAARGSITTEQVEQLFAYGKMHQLSAASMPATNRFQKLGAHMAWEAEPGFYKGYQSIRPQTVPAHVKWHNNPLFAYVGVVEGELEYRYSEGSGAAWYICPVTTQPEHIQLIDRIFQAWYQHLNLPHSLSETSSAHKPAQPKVPQLLHQYLQNGSTGFFHENFQGRNDLVLWIDWGQTAEDIVAHCEQILQTGTLSLSPAPADAANQGTYIRYKETRRKLPAAADTDHQVTLQALNELLAPDFEIRAFKATSGDGLLAFLPLASGSWAQLEQQYGNKVLLHFGKTIRQSR